MTDIAQAEGSEQRVLAAIDAGALVRDLQAVVRARSVTGDEAEAQAVVATCADAAGLAVETWEMDLEELRHAIGYPGEEAARTRAVGLAARLGEGRRRIVLNGHVDTVAAGTESWQRDPFSGEVAGGHVHGRGALDMKAGLVAAMHALRAIRAAGVRLGGEAVLQSVASEEDGGLGTFDAVRRLGHADAALIPEPTALELVTAQAGALTFEGVVEGHSAHAAFRLEGTSAIDRYLPLHEALHRLEQERNRDVSHPLMSELELPYPILVGRLEAGEWSSTVPDRLRFEGRVGVRVGEPVEDARAAVERVCAGVVSQLRWAGGQFASADTPVDHPFTGLVRRAAADVLGSEPRVVGVPYGADMRLFTAAGIPCVMIGAGDPHAAHAPDESVPVDEVVDACRIMALTVLRFLGEAG
jgi:acetylornithine deacetylase